MNPSVSTPVSAGALATAENQQIAATNRADWSNGEGGAVKMWRLCHAHRR